MKLLSQKGISVAPPERAAVPSAIPAVPSAIPVVPSVIPAVPAVSSAVPAPAVPAPAVSVPAVSVPAVPFSDTALTAHTTTAELALPISNTLIINTELNLSTSMAVTPQRPSTPVNELAELDISMESPPLPEGSSRATGGILRNRAMGQHYNPVDDEELQISSIIEKVKGVVKIYVSSLDPVELDFTKMKPSLKVLVTVNMNLGPVLKEVAVRWPPISRK